MPDRTPPSVLIRLLGRPLAHALGIGGVVMAIAAILTFFDPGYWHYVFPWDGNGAREASSGAFGAILVLIGGRLLEICRRGSGGKGEG
jgi:hypothetical protein